MATEPNAKPAFTGLSEDFIAELLGKQRVRNAYGPKLIDFIDNSDENGINVVETWPVDFGKKNVATLYQGFMKAVKDASLQDTIMVIRRDEQVFLLHKERLTIVDTATTEPETTEE